MLADQACQLVYILGPPGSAAVVTDDVIGVLVLLRGQHLVQGLGTFKGDVQQVQPSLVRRGGYAWQRPFDGGAIQRHEGFLLVFVGAEDQGYVIEIAAGKAGYPAAGGNDGTVFDGAIGAQ